MTGSNPIAVGLQSISDVSAVNALIAFYYIHGRKGEMPIPYTTRDMHTRITRKRQLCIDTNSYFEQNISC
jgi:hypothetical protein